MPDNNDTRVRVSKPRADCSECGRSVVVRKDGAVQGHRDHRTGWTCAGSYLTPEGTRTECACVCSICVDEAAGR